MPHRFTNTDKWRSQFLRKKDKDAKLLWLWLKDNCDCAGFWEVDLELAHDETGIELDNIETVFMGLQRGFIGASKPLPRGIEGAYEWIWIRDFLSEQKNLPLNTENPAHRGIIKRIEQQAFRFPDIYSELEKIHPTQAPSKPLPRGKGKGNGKSNSQRGGPGERDTQAVWILKQELDATERLMDLTNDDDKKRALCREKRRLLEKIRQDCNQSERASV